MDTDPCFTILYSKKEAKIATAEELISSMDRDGIDISVVQNIGWTTHDLCVQTNNYIIARYPGRLVGFCSVQPQAFDAAFKEIERCVKAGAKGIGELRPDMQLFELTDEELMVPFVDVLRKNNLTLLLHTSEPVGHHYPGKGTVTPETLYPFITRFPDLKIVCAHWGGGLPFYALMPEVKKSMENVYFDTAATPYLYMPQIFEHADDLVGADKILMGSDFPLMAQSRLIDEIRSTSLSTDKKNMILSENARYLLDMEVI